MSQTWGLLAGSAGETDASCNAADREQSQVHFLSTCRAPTTQSTSPCRPDRGGLAGALCSIHPQNWQSASW